jgi:hypothetical protein
MHHGMDLLPFIVNTQEVVIIYLGTTVFKQI